MKPIYFSLFVSLPLVSLLCSCGSTGSALPPNPLQQVSASDPSEVLPEVRSAGPQVVATSDRTDRAVSDVGETPSFLKRVASDPEIDGVQPVDGENLAGDFKLLPPPTLGDTEEPVNSRESVTLPEAGAINAVAEKATATKLPLSSRSPIRQIGADQIIKEEDRTLGTPLGVGHVQRILR